MECKPYICKDIEQSEKMMCFPHDAAKAAANRSYAQTLTVYHFSILTDKIQNKILFIQWHHFGLSSYISLFTCKPKKKTTNQSCLQCVIRCTTIKSNYRFRLVIFKCDFKYAKHRWFWSGHLMFISIYSRLLSATQINSDPNTQQKMCERTYLFADWAQTHTHTHKQRSLFRNNFSETIRSGIHFMIALCFGLIKIFPT